MINESQIINVNRLRKKNPNWRWNIEQTPEPYCRSIEAIVGRNERKWCLRLIFDLGLNTKLAILFNRSLLIDSSFCIWWRSKRLNESGQSSFIWIYEIIFEKSWSNSWNKTPAI